MNNLNLTRQELEKAVKDKGLEVYSEAQMLNFISSNEDILKSGSMTEELDEFQKSEYETMVEELRSFSAVDVYDQEGLTIKKSKVYVRPKQVEFDEVTIEKSEDGEEIEKARSGVYTDTALNRKLGRVGQKYGSKKQSTDEGDDKKKPEEKSEEYYEKLAEERNKKKLAEKEKNAGVKIGQSVTISNANRYDSLADKEVKGIVTGIKDDGRIEVSVKGGSYNVKKEDIK